MSKRLAALARWAWLALPLLALPLIWPFLTRGLPQSADGALHLLRLVVLDSHIAAGVLYPRWTPELFLGFGYPVFSFYGPVSYYLAEALHLLGLGHSFALVGAFILLIVFAGLGMFLFTRDVAAAAVRGRRGGATVAALVASMAYMATPYLLTNAYLRGALGEVGAQALLPWIFWSFRRLARDRRPGSFLLPAALSLGGLAATHNITLLFLPPVLLSYLFVMAWPRPFAWRTLARQLAWPVAGGLAAMGVSAFFWLPLLVERPYLSSVAFDIAATYVLENIWTWQNFLDLSLHFEYTLSIPFQLGLVQLVLGIAGFALWPRREREWWFWGVTGLVASLGISQLAAPLWLGSDLLLIAQFPWRLLTIAALPLALFASGGLLRIRRPAPRWLTAAALLALILWANRLDGALLKPLIADNRNLDLPQVTQFELDTAAYGTSSASEFMPRWAADGLFAPRPAATPTSSDQVELAVTAAGPLALTARVNAATPAPLELTTFYFPGWVATLDGAALPTRPSPDRGLLTVDLPAGKHQLAVFWQGTPVQSWGALISLATLALLTGWLLFGSTVEHHAKTQRRRGEAMASSPLAPRPRPDGRLWAVIPAALLLFGAVATLRTSETSTVPVAPVNSEVQPGLRLIGLRTDERANGRLHLFPYWQVQGTLARLRLRWQLLTPDGTVAAQTTVEPYFNALATPLLGSIQAEPPATLVDDAVTLALPPALAAGSYTLHVQPVGPDGAALAAPVQAGVIALAGSAPPPPKPATTVGAQFGDDLLLAGYDVTQNGGAPVLHNGRYLLAKPGDRLAYTLAWNGADAAQVNYHSFLHLLNHDQQAVAQSDQLPGPVFSPPRLWQPFYPEPDRHELVLPADAPGGVYTPATGLYRYDDQTRLTAHSADGVDLGSQATLGPVKVVGKVTAQAQTPLRVGFGDVADFLGYTMDAPASLAPGVPFTVTLYYQANGPAPLDYTQFLHLYDPALGMAAQRDQQPLNGGNPTTAWVQGETIAEPIVLTVAPDAAPGSYSLLLGWYDAQANFARIPLSDEARNPLADNQAVLVEVVVGQ